MKLILNILDKVRPLFEDGGKLQMMKPAFDAADNLFFAAHAKTPGAPFGRDPMDVKRFMSMVILALLPCLAAAVYLYGWRVLAVVMVSYMAGGVVEVVFAVVRKEEIAEGFLVTGLIFPLVLPPGLPLWMVALGVVFGTLIGKEIFGGTGRNVFNPAIVGRVFLALSYPAAMTTTWLPAAQGGLGRLTERFTLLVPDSITSATPLVDAKGGVFADTMDLFLGRIPGSCGESCALAILVGGLFLLATGVASWRTVVATLGGFAGMAAFLRIMAPEASNPVLFSLLSGGILYGAFFMATDPVSSPVTHAGKWAYGLIIGCTAMLIRTFSGYVEGVMFAILLGNICAPLIDEVVIRARMRRYRLEG